jgi:hypothetical protein
LSQVKAEKARRCLKEFVMQAWPILEPETHFVDGLHINAICSHLQAVTEGRIQNLIINVPPGHAKSLLVGVFWLAWVWIDHPHTRWLFNSYREPLATRDSVKCRRLIESDWYQKNWGGCFQLTGDQNQKNRFENDRTGYRQTCTGLIESSRRTSVKIVSSASTTRRWNSRPASATPLSSGHAPMTKGCGANCNRYWHTITRASLL